MMVKSFSFGKAAAIAIHIKAEAAGWGRTSPL
jgi:hypothetical protein